jgi:hypothetical protein
MTNPGRMLSFNTVVDSGYKELRNEDGRLHCLDSPAIEWSTGLKMWCVNGKLHRFNGPAIERHEYREWYVDGKKLTKEQFDQHPLVIFYRLCKEHA